MPASPRSACSSTAVDWPRRTTSPRVLGGEPAPRRLSGGIVEQDLARSGHRLDPRGGRDGLAGQTQVAVQRRRRGGHDLAGRQTDPDVHRLAAHAEVLQPGADGEGGQRGTDRVIVVCPRPAEDGEHAHRR